MRKLLLAATAMVGAVGMAGVASAQVMAPGAYTANPNASGYYPGTGTVSGSTVVVAPPPSPSSSASVPAASVTPGNVVVRIQALVVTDFYLGSDSSNGYKNPVNGVTTKNQPYYFGEFARLFPSFDGQTANGIKYGIAVEIRQNSGGTGTNLAFANNSSTAGNTLFFRRETGYVAMDKLGMLRFGQTDGILGLYNVGTFESADVEGGWNGDLPGMFSGGGTAGSGTQLPFFFTDTSTWYGTTKIIYLSPNFAGFDFGIDFEPAQQTSNGDGNCAGVGGNFANNNVSPNVGSNNLGCAGASSESGPFSVIQSDLQRRRNTTTLGARYRGAFGPVGLVATGSWVHSGHVSDANTATDSVYYNGLNFFDGGAVVTWGGLAAGGHLIAGSKNGSTLQPKGAKDELDFILGASYAIGPFIAGVQFMNESLQGQWNGNAATHVANSYGLEHDIGLSVGGSYNWAPGATLYVDYLWGQRHQANRDFLAGAAGKFNNNTRAQGIVIGNSFKW